MKKKKSLGPRDLLFLTKKIGSCLDKANAVISTAILSLTRAFYLYSTLTTYKLSQAPVVEKKKASIRLSLD